jgi:hypothetical protein
MLIGDFHQCIITSLLSCRALRSAHRVRSCIFERTFFSRRPDKVSGRENSFEPAARCVSLKACVVTESLPECGAGPRVSARFVQSPGLTRGSDPAQSSQASLMNCFRRRRAAHEVRRMNDEGRTAGRDSALAPCARARQRSFLRLILIAGARRSVCDQSKPCLRTAPVATAPSE